MPSPMILLSFPQVGMLWPLLLTFCVFFALSRTYPFILTNVRYALKENFPGHILLPLINLPLSFTLFCLGPLLILVLLMAPHYRVMIHIFSHVLNVLPDLMSLTTLLIGCLCLLWPPTSTALPLHVTCGLFSAPPYVIPSPLYSFLSVLNGSVVKLGSLWLSLDTSFPPASFLITDALLNFMCTIHACVSTGYFSFSMESD